MELGENTVVSYSRIWDHIENIYRETNGLKLDNFPHISQLNVKINNFIICVYKKIFLPNPKRMYV